eukprot:3505132-Prymnesium_polylepis.1
MGTDKAARASCSQQNCVCYSCGLLLRWSTHATSDGKDTERTHNVHQQTSGRRPAQITCQRLPRMQIRSFSDDLIAARLKRVRILKPCNVENQRV